MSLALSVSASNLSTANLQANSNDTHISKTICTETPSLKSPQNINISKRKLLRGIGFGIINGGLLVVQPTRAEPENTREFGSSSNIMSYSRLLKYIEQGMVRKVDLYENGSVAVAEIMYPGLSRIQRARVELNRLSEEALLRRLKAKNIDFAAHPVEPNLAAMLLDFLGNYGFPLFLLGSLLFRGASMNQGGPNLPFGLGRSKAKFQMEPNTGITFEDVAGVDEAKQDFQEIVEFLKTPEKFTAAGARLPKGVLLVGPPGTGKTLLAKAIAGEAGVPFFSLSGSEFVEMFVGVGASRVRDLFNKAKMNSPCLVFIDEIDAIGRQRGTGIGGGNDEREQTLNQLLTEMDGFSGNSGVIVIAATNRPEILDSALLRPGRFDRQVTVGLPDIRGREEILKVHIKNKKLDENVSVNVIAMRTPGFSGADLANLINESAILAGRRGKEKITTKEIDDSIDRIVAGMEGTKMADGKSKILVAYHEIGHAICATLTPGHDPVQKVTLVPRGQARGLTWFTPNDDPALVSKQQLFARIVGGLGGRATEEIIFGESEVTTGATGDLQQITQIARQMVTTFGMSEIGPWSLIDPSVQSRDVVLRMLARNNMSEKLAEDIDSVDIYHQKLPLHPPYISMSDAKPVNTPLACHFRLSTEQSPKNDDEENYMAKVPYASTIGNLMCAMVCTRPDTAHAVGVVSRFMKNPSKQHWEAVKWILRYLRGTTEKCLCFGKLKLQGFIDADFAGEVDHRRSTTDYVFTVSGTAVSWISQLQKIVALSTTEAEYVAKTEASK